MQKIKDFGMLAQVMSNPVEKNNSSKGLGGVRKTPDCQYYKTRKECNQTRFLMFDEEHEVIVKVVVDKFLFPNEIRKYCREKNARLICFQWSSPKIKSPIYNLIVSRRKLKSEISIVILNKKDPKKGFYMEYITEQNASALLNLEGLLEVSVCKVWG